MTSRPTRVAVPMDYENDASTGMNRGRSYCEVPIEYDPGLPSAGMRRINPYGPCPIVLREWNEQVFLHELLHVLLDGSVPTSNLDPHGHRTISRVEVALWESGWRWQR